MKRKTFLTLLDWLAVAAYAGTNAFILTRHEPWQEEAAAWLIARDAPLKVFFSEIRQLPFPAFWPAVLLPLAKAGLPFAVQSFAHLAFAAASSALVVFFSPFSRVTKYAFVFSFTMMSEYGIPAQAYAPSLFLLFAAAALHEKRFHRPLLYAAVLFLLFNGSYLLFPAASALAILFAADAPGKKKLSAIPTAAFFLMAAGAVLAAVQFLRFPSETVFRAASRPDFGVVLSAVRQSMIPTFTDISGDLAAWIAGAAVIFSVLSLASDRRTLLAAFLSSLGLFYFYAFTAARDIRDYGLFLAVMLVFLWIARPAGPEPGKIFGIRLPDACSPASLRKSALAVITFCLLLSIKYTAGTHYLNYRYWFSGSKPAAAQLGSMFRELPDYAVIAYPSSATQTLLAYLPGRKFWYADLEADGTYVPWADAEKNAEELTDEKLILKALSYFRHLGKSFLLVTRPLAIREAFGYEFRQVLAVERGVYGRGLEHFYLYLPLFKAEKRGPA